MYTPAHFREDRSDVLHDAMRSIAFATLITQGLEANHLPLLLVGNTLCGHVARPNPVWKAGDGPALAIFLGEHFYVTPSWYPTKQETGKAVPTWNYVTVHARGALRWIHDADWLKDHVTALSASQENRRAEPWAVSDAPAGYIDGLLRAIVGFELTIESLEGKAKLSQNRELRDREGVRDGLSRENRDDLAQLIP